MKKAIILLMVAFIGCTTSQQAQLPSDQPELVSLTPLPPLNSEFSYSGLRLNVLLHILKDGSIDQVRMLSTSGDEEWDSLARQCIQEWKFSSPLRDGVVSDLWVRQMLIVQVQSPMTIAVGEMEAATRGEADSLYALMQNGVEFDSLARELQQSSSAVRVRFLGAVDVAVFAPQVRTELRGLAENDITRPIRVGNSFVIYKRFSNAMSSRLQD